MDTTRTTSRTSMDNISGPTDIDIDDVGTSSVRSTNMGTTTSRQGNLDNDTIGSNMSGAQVRGGVDNTSGPGPYIMSADSLEGDSVVNSQGEDLGDIKAIMIDVPKGRVAYVVLSFGGFLGMGDKLFAIPWSALTLDADRKCFVLDIPKDRLENAPGFDKDHWPTMADQRWATEIHSFYGRRPYWEV